MNNFIFPDEVIIKELSIISAENNEKKCVIKNSKQEVIALAYPQFDGETLISLFMDKKVPPLIYRLINNNEKLSVDVYFDMIKTMDMIKNNCLILLNNAAFLL